MSDAAHTRGPAARSRRERLLLVASLVLDVAVGLFPYSVSGLVAPRYGQWSLYGIWVASVALLLLIWRRRPGGRWLWRH